MINMVSVSILMVTYNRSKFIREAIESILFQSFKDWELVIIDDASTDDTDKIITEYNDSRIKYYKNESNLGIAKSRNKALSISSGKYVAVLDSDDVWYGEDKLEKQYNFLENNPYYVLVGGAVIVIDENGKEIKRYVNPVTDEQIRSEMLWRNPFLHSSVLIRKDICDKCSGYSEDFIIGEDYTLWLKIGQYGKLSNFTDFLVKYRIHESGITLKNRIKAGLDTLKIVYQYVKVYPNGRKALIKSYFRVLYSIYLAILKK